MIKVISNNKCLPVEVIEALANKYYDGYNGTITVDLTKSEYKEPKQEFIKPDMDESMLQMVCVSWFRDNFPNCILAASLNGIKLTGTNKYGVIVKQKREGLEPGWPDLDIAIHNGVTLHIEMKTTATSSKQSPGQIAIQAKLEALGHKYFTIRTFQQFKELINKHIKEI